MEPSFPYITRCIIQCTFQLIYKFKQNKIKKKVIQFYSDELPFVASSSDVSEGFVGVLLTKQLQEITDNCID